MAKLRDGGGVKRRACAGFPRGARAAAHALLLEGLHRRSVALQTGIGNAQLFLGQSLPALIAK